MTMDFRQVGWSQALTVLAPVVLGFGISASGPYLPDGDREALATNAVAATLSRTDSVLAATDGPTGLGVIVGAWDAGTVDAAHPDFGGRVQVLDGSGAASHPTHVAGTIMGAGTGDASARGMAPEATLLSHDFYGDLLAEQRAAWQTYGMVLANHSWDYAAGWLYDRYGDGYWVWYGGAGNEKDAEFGAYTAVTRAWDALVVETGLILVKSSGNDRNDYGAGSAPHHHSGEPDTLYTDHHAPDGDYDSIGSLGVAKNVITVGAVDDDGGMTAFSGWGPADDGRVKPDLVANGLGLWSTDAGGSYGIKSGTSMSTAVVTGSLALVVERHQAIYGEAPSPARAKALLVNTARDLGTAGPDYVYGWGLLDTWSAVNTVTASANSTDGWPMRNGSLGSGEVRTFPVDVPEGLEELRVTLAWTDPAAPVGAGRALVNDLDLELVDPDGVVHHPFSLAGPADPAAPATADGPNRVDNVEQVRVAAPAAGRWEVRVSGAAVSGRQDWELVANVYTGENGPVSTEVPAPSAGLLGRAAVENTTPAAGSGGGGAMGLPALGLLLLTVIAGRRPRRSD